MPPGLWLRDVPEPRAGPGEVLVRVLRTGICGTDLHIRAWDAWAQQAIRPPLTLGHEIAGLVELGPGVDTLADGDLVSVEGHVVCGRCRWCLGGQRQLCPNTVSIGIDRDGGFAELVVVPATNVWRHPHPVDPEVAAIFDPFGNAVHASLAFPVLGEDVLVTGAGPIGLMSAAVVRHAGARHVVITDLSVSGSSWLARWGPSREPSTSPPPRCARSWPSWAWSRASTWAWRCRGRHRRCTR